MDNNNKDINSYDIKCAEHESKYRFICITCNLALCDLCIVSVHHRGHETDIINEESAAPIINEFKNEYFETLTECSNKIEELFNESNTIFNKIEEEHIKNINTITKKFKNLYTILQTIEKDSIRKLVTYFDDNKEINTKISKLANNYLISIDRIQNKYKDFNYDEQLNTNNKNYKNEKLEILKHCHQTKLFLKEISCESQIKKFIGEYDNVILETFFKKFKSSAKEIIKINFESEDPTSVLIEGINYPIYKEGENIEFGTNLALGPSVKNLIYGFIPPTVNSVILLDGFKVGLTEGMLPNSVEVLYVGAIKKPLFIPPSVSVLFLTEGFNQRIDEIPPSIKSIYIYTPHPITFPPDEYISYNYSIYVADTYQNNYNFNDVRIQSSDFDLDIELEF
ncbi:hypothetical protein RB653_004008 [Dictyostelium firmibasis]|uniref:B box-type domain-containing protein n=1 Tax=Dictyostelium firmibasis TaxID=79012 RepID=A0AAN7UIJ9_9MYCE